ncbi:hypothetical protein AB0903_33610 [Streptomyces sp. NPDC048389]|uniref:hypothetical protein n=1 Tax=Streptomyces sp. NPDC048389 TaxID=3154622 RepID=UPI003456396F
MRLTRRVTQTVTSNLTTLAVFYGAFQVTGQWLLPLLAARGVTVPVWLEVTPC